MPAPPLSWKAPIWRGAVAERGHADVTAAAQLGGQRIATGRRDAAADDGAGHDAALAVPEVHRAAAAVAEALLETHDLGQRALHRVGHGLGHRVGGEGVEVLGRGRQQQLGDHVVVRAMGRGEPVGLAQGQRRAGRGGLLADARVERSVHEVGVVEQPLLEAADGLDAEDGQAQRALGRGRQAVRRVSLDLDAGRVRWRALRSWSPSSGAQTMVSGISSGMCLAGGEDDREHAVDGHDVALAVEDAGDARRWPWTPAPRWSCRSRPRRWAGPR